jgi:multidrug efflux pump
MTLYKLSIERPVLADGDVHHHRHLRTRELQAARVREFPAVDPPDHHRHDHYTGAPPEVIESQITEPLEENLNSVAGIRTLTSVSREGRSMITVEFELGADLETAANDVRD